MKSLLTVQQIRALSDLLMNHHTDLSTHEGQLLVTDLVIDHAAKTFKCRVMETVAMGGWAVVSAMMKQAEHHTPHRDRQGRVVGVTTMLGFKVTNAVSKFLGEDPMDIVRYEVSGTFDRTHVVKIAH